MKKETIISLLAAGAFLLATAFLVGYALVGGVCCKL